MAAPGAPVGVVITAVKGGVRIQIASAGLETHHYEIFQSISDKYWKYNYPAAHRVVVGGVQYLRIATSTYLIGLDRTDQTCEAGIAYTYFVRAIGNDLVSYTDSAPTTVACVLESTWLTPFISAVGAVIPVNSEFRWPETGLSESPDRENIDLLFAGREYPVTDFGIHKESNFGVTLDLPAGEFAAGYGDEAVLRGYALDGTMLVFRDKRGRKAYGRIAGLKFADSKYGKNATFTFKSLDISGAS